MVSVTPNEFIGIQTAKRLLKRNTAEAGLLT
jgi:hypothetical protein